MSVKHFPNETETYRDSRNALLEKEKALRALVDEVARQRRALPLGGQLKERYRFERVGTTGNVEQVLFETLFGQHESLLVYTMMFGPDWDAPCPSCTSLVDGFNVNYHPVSHHCAMAVVAAASPRQLDEWATSRGWTLPLYSAGSSDYILDYFPRDDLEDPALVTMMNCFRRSADGVYHSWGSELVAHPKENGHPCHVDTVWPFWNLLDMTAEGRGDACVPVQDFRHDYFTRKVFPGED
ncbi:MAG: DUF899 family protein [Xanthomonadales bacterium]|nr:DUF899 family protein [Xanthomonadales bacterium]